MILAIAFFGVFITASKARYHELFPQCPCVPYTLTNDDQLIIKQGLMTHSLGYPIVLLRATKDVEGRITVCGIVSPGTFSILWRGVIDDGFFAIINSGSTPSTVGAPLRGCKAGGVEFPRDEIATYW
jgi:hypothetical protein